MTEQLPERTFGWSNMFTPTRESDPREQGDSPAGERDTLARFLRDYRLTLELKCEGLDAGAMAAQSVPPSRATAKTRAKPGTAAVSRPAPSAPCRAT